MHSRGGREHWQSYSEFIGELGLSFRFSKRDNTGKNEDIASIVTMKTHF
jgi:hypothetical protein